LTPLVGIFVGGASRRMGGAPKGMLRVPLEGAPAGRDEPIVGRLVRIVRSLDLDVVLVGPGEAYDVIDAPRIDDVARDLPRLSPSIVRRLATSEHETCAPKSDGVWQSLVSRWSASALVLAERHLAERRLALHALLDALGAAELTLDPDERLALADWDSPADVSA